MRFGSWYLGRTATSVLDGSGQFSMVAGSCSADDAKCLQTIRNEKKYRALGLTWEQLCKGQLGISRSTADQIIRDLEDCGEAYFPMAWVTGITAEQYRRLRPAVSGQNLLHPGQEIPIDAEHATELTAAIAADIVCRAGEGSERRRPRAHPRGEVAARGGVGTGVAERTRAGRR